MGDRGPGQAGGLPGPRPDEQTAQLNYERDKELLRTFLMEFSLAGDGADKSERPYVQALADIASRASKVLHLSMDDLYLWGERKGHSHIAETFEKNAERYMKLLAEAGDECLLDPSNGFQMMYDETDPLEVLLKQLDQQKGFDYRALPPELMRRFEVQVSPSIDAKASAIRSVHASQIGHLVTIRAIVVRVTDVKPRITVATYLSMDPTTGEQRDVYQEVPGKTFMQQQLPTQRMVQAGIRGNLMLMTRGSKFIKFQELKIQELADQVPMGHIPRSMTVRVMGELTRRVKPGETATITGVFMPEPYTGLKAMRAGLVTNVYLMATNISKEKESFSEVRVREADVEVVKRLHEASREDGESIYDKLARSIAPEIYGMRDVKKALLLLLVGGVTRRMGDGIKLRGDIHMCLMGDPGVAKSQLLKHISVVAPRAVCTNGRGSSGVGLTAAVTRDPNTSEMVLEGGALVLADKGICCIDEFDKMDEGDRTAIHEVMEQQTVSIAKAGITTQLNARTAVLAAANPAWGRYEIRRSAQENINLPASLLSRFDIMWLLLDTADWDRDTALAQHVLHVHRHRRAPALESAALSAEELRQYIAVARQYEPTVPMALTDQIAADYADMRKEHDGKGREYVTPRTLMSVLRMSQALARIRMSDTVSFADVKEARRLMDMSKASLDVASAGNGRDDNDDHVNRVYAIIRKKAQAIEKRNAIEGVFGAEISVAVDEIRKAAALQGCGDEAVDKCLEEYEELGLWKVGEDNMLVWVADDGDA